MLYHKPALKVLSACSHEIPGCSHRRRVGGNRSRARKWYRGRQNLEVKAESQSLTIESGKPRCINCYLRLVVYHFRKPTDDDGNRIVTGALPTMSRYREQLQVSIVFPGNEFSSFLDTKVPSSWCLGIAPLPQDPLSPSILGWDVFPERISRIEVAEGGRAFCRKKTLVQRAVELVKDLSVLGSEIFLPLGKNVIEHQQLH